MNKYKLPVLGQHTENVVLANGEFPSHPIALSILENCEYLVCCDGAVNNLVKTDKLPDAIVGDCDSLSPENRERFADIIHHVAEQNTNDLTKAVNYCILRDKTKITILGATGKREDHTIGNISLLCEYMNYADVEMITDYGIFNTIDRDAVFECSKGQQVSIFSIDHAPLTSYNLAYPISNQIFTNWWQATLNEAQTNEFYIETTGRTIVYRAF